MPSSGWFSAYPVSRDLAPELTTGWIASSVDGRALVPDACVDLMWLDGTAWVCGAETTGWTFRTPVGSEAVGLRFRAGRAASVLGFAPVDVRDRRVPLGDVLPRRLRDVVAQLEDAQSSRHRLAILERHARPWLADAPDADPLVTAVVREFSARATTVHAFASEHALSERQLLRRVHAAFGYGPATLRRILRLQRLLRSVDNSRGDVHVATLAASAGYADQQHLARDVRRIARMTPTALVASRAGG